MTKELEELKGITKNKIEYIKKQPKIDWIYLKYYEGVLNLVTRIEAIDNANPSEALENLKQQAIAFERSELAIKVADGNYNAIKQALLKAQEQEKVLEVIKNKALPKQERDMIIQSENYEQYIIKISWWNYKPFMIPKTEEEFYLLKRWV